MSPPVQKPHRSTQVVRTPPAFIEAVEHRFGPITWDLAATEGNRVRPVGWYGPGSSGGADALKKAWHELGSDLLWLNPPFENIAPWADKCMVEAELGAHIAFLVPLASSNWARDFVHGHAAVEALNPRLKFVGHASAYPKDLMLCMFGPDVCPSFSVWSWDLAARRARTAPFVALSCGYTAPGLKESEKKGASRENRSERGTGGVAGRGRGAA